MKPRGLVAAGLLAAAGLLTGCGADRPNVTVACMRLGRPVLDEIADGLVVDAAVARAQAVELPLDQQRYGFQWVAAVELRGKGGDRTAVLGLDNPKDPRRITNAGPTATASFAWGGASQQGSAMATYQQDLYRSDASRTAQDCL
jgi:hypothetical protein